MDLKVSREYEDVRCRVKSLLKLLKASKGEESWPSITGPHVCLGCGAAREKWFICSCHSCGSLKFPEVESVCKNDELNPQVLNRFDHDKLVVFLDLFLERSVRSGFTPPTFLNPKIVALQVKLLACTEESDSIRFDGYKAFLPASYEEKDYLPDYKLFKATKDKYLLLNHPVLKRLNTARALRNEAFVKRASPFASLCEKGVFSEVIQFADLNTLASISTLCHQAHALSKRAWGPITRSTALKKFPILRIQLPFIERQPSIDFRDVYKRLKRLNNEFDELNERPLPIPTTTLDDYLFVCQIELNTLPPQSFAYLAKSASDAHFELVTDSIDIQVVRHAKEFLSDDFLGPSVKILLTCLHKASGKQCVLYKCDEVMDIDLDSILYEPRIIPRRQGIEDFLDNFNGDFTETVECRAGICGSFEPPDANDVYISFEIQSWGPGDVETLSIEAGLILLESDVQFS